MYKDQDNWARHFDIMHKDQIDWRVNHDIHNMQRAVQVMTMSKPDCVNIVQLGGMHKVMVVDADSPKSYNTVTKDIGDAGCVDRNLRFENGLMQESTLRMAIGGAQDLALTEKDQKYVEAYQNRNYIAQSKWELHTAIAIIDKHAKASGHDIRIIPYKQSDHSTATLSKQNQWQIDTIARQYNHKRIFWYNNQGAKEWQEQDYPTIVKDHLQPWLDKDI